MALIVKSARAASFSVTFTVYGESVNTGASFASLMLMVSGCDTVVEPSVTLTVSK